MYVAQLSRLTGITNKLSLAKGKFFSILAGLIFSFLLTASNVNLAADIQLPELSDSASGIVSHHQEYVLGRTWLKAFRAQSPIYYDAITQQYIEKLIYHLTANSQLNDRRLEVVLVQNPTLNAFAVPGGVVGIHTGIFNYAETEAQLASILSHELAHLSQRHFARGVEARQNSSIVNMAGLLAGLIIAATSGGDAGMAVISATQAAALDSQLRYSRQNEQEADRIGIDTMYKSDMDPKAMAGMFERMLRSTRYSGYRVPEFLRSHPLTEKRVADAKGRISDYPQRFYTDSLQYHLIKARIWVNTSKNPHQIIKEFQSKLQGDAISREAARYGLTLALIKTGQLAEAKHELKILTDSNKLRLYDLAEIDILRAQRNFEDAEHINIQHLKNHPNDYSLKMALAETYIKWNRYDDANKILDRLSKTRPFDPQIWYELAEARGLAGDISGVHLARAEYFILVGAFDLAREQFGYAQKLSRSDFKTSAIIQQRLEDLLTLEKQIENL